MDYRPADARLPLKVKVEREYSVESNTANKVETRIMIVSKITFNSEN